MLRCVLAVIRHMSHAWLTEVYAVTEMSSSIFSTDQREPDHGSHFVLECSQTHTHTSHSLCSGTDITAGKIFKQVFFPVLSVLFHCR